MSKTVFMRGLQNFIQDIRACQSKEQEERRVDKELVKIRAAFHDDKNLSGYDKRKYVWKLLYIYMMGYKIDFGHKQACDLIPKPKYKDKQVGYMACSILLHENDEFLRLVINGVHMDLTSRNEAFECLALSFIGSVGGSEMVDALVPGILKLLTSGASRPIVKKRAALCLLRMIRRTPADHPVVNPDTFAGTLNELMEEPDLGLLLSSVTLFCGILAKSGPGGYESCQARLIRILDRLVHVRSRDIQAEYQYYGIPSPWLQSKCVRALQYFPAPESGPERQMLRSSMQGIIENPAAFAEGKSANPNKINAILCIMFEAISLAFHIESDAAMLASCAAALGRLLHSREPNIRYLTLEMLSRMAAVPSLAPTMQQYTATVQGALRDPDQSIRRKAMDLQVAMCDPSNVQGLVASLLAQHASEGPMSREMVFKLSMLAEKHAPSLHWYVDTVYQLLERYGDVAPDETWQRLVTGVAAQPSVQPHAARSMVELLRRGSTHESVACTAAYILGEYGGRIKADVPCMEQFRLLYRLFPSASAGTKGLLLTAFVKMLLQDHQNRQLRMDVGAMFEANQKFLDAELQQRAAEMMALSDDPNTPVAQLVLQMPKFPDQDTALLLPGSSNLTNATSGSLISASPGQMGAASSSSAFPAIPAAGAELSAASASAAPAAPAPAEQSMMFDLLGEEAILPAGGSSDATGQYHAQDTGASASAGGAPSPSGPPAVAPSPIDLLSDLFGDVVNTAPPPGTAPALPPPPQAPAPAPGMDPAGLYAAAAAAPLVAMPASNNPFAASFPAPAAAAAPFAAPAAQYAAPAAQYAAPAPIPGVPPVAPAPFPPAAAAAPFAAAPPPSSNNPFTAAWPAAAPAPAAVAPVAPFPAAPVAPAPVAFPPPAPAPVAAAETAVPSRSAHTFALGDPFSALASSALGPAPAAAYAPAPAAAAAPVAAPAPLAPPPAPAPAPAPWGGVATAAPLPVDLFGAPSPSHSSAAPAATGLGWGAAAPAAGAAAGVAAAATWGAPAAPTPAVAAHFEPVQPVGDIQRWFESLLFKDRGVLYEDQYLQVGLQSRYLDGRGDVVLYLGNKNADHGLEQVSVSAASSASVAAVVDYPVPRNLVPKEQVQVVIKVSCLGHVEDVPTLTLHYRLGSLTVSQPLRLPVTSHRFLAPEPGIAKELFFEQWKSLGNPPAKSQEMVSRTSPAQSEAIVTMLRQVNLGVEHGYLDPSPYNEAGAAYFVCGPAGAEQRVLVMCRVEGNPQNMSQFRVTVVSAIPALSAWLKQTIVQRLTSL